MHKKIDETMINRLREKVASILSPQRFSHTLGVEQMAFRIGSELAIDSDGLNVLRCAALLHDITKEYSFEKQLKICDEFGIILRDDEISCPQILHAITASSIISCEHSDFNIPEIVSAVRWHTTGKRNMSVFDKIICLSDFIEDGRKYDSCVSIRNDFWAEMKSCTGNENKLLCLDNSLRLSLEATVDNITNKGGIVNLDTIEAIESLFASR